MISSQQNSEICEGSFELDWSALLGGVLKLTGKLEAAYVGHSNGGRVALDMLSNWDSLKGTTVGTMTDGTAITLPTNNPITNYIGVGVPGAFDAPTMFTKIIDEGKGDVAINNLEDKGKNHIKISEIGVELKTMTGIIYSALTMFDDTKISLNLLKKYVSIVNSTTDLQPGINTAISKVKLIYGNILIDDESDIVVPISDILAIYSNLISSDKSIKETSVIHVEQTTNKKVKTEIKEALNE